MKIFFRKKISNNRKIIFFTIVVLFSFVFIISPISETRASETPTNAPLPTGNETPTAKPPTAAGSNSDVTDVPPPSSEQLRTTPEVVGKGICGTGVCSAVITVLSWIIYGFAYVAGLLLTFIIWMFVEIIQYNDFINVPAVVTGWVIIRDLCNMFFVLILLFIAFATILRMESYSAKKLLPKLIIMAVLINFSRTIFGLIIDFGQVIMLTFVNGFAEFGASEFVKIFQVNEYLSFANTNASVQAIGGLATFGALVAGFIALLITLVVMVVFVAIIVMRIVMLWIYTILSPLVFFGRAFPAAEKYTEQIWGDFIKQVIVGPMLAFFLWLALSTAQPSAKTLRDSWAAYNPIGKGSASFQNAVQLQGQAQKDVAVTGTLNSLFNAENFQRYIIVIAMLIGGLMVTQQMGGAAASIAGKGLGAIQKGRGLAWGGMKAGADWLNRMQWEGGALKRFGWKGTGVDLNLKRSWGTLSAKMESMKKSQIGLGMQRSKEVMDTHGRMWGTLAMTGNAGDAWEQITTWKGLKQRFFQGTRGGIFGTGGGKGLNIKQERELAKLKGEDSKLDALKAERANVINSEQEKGLKGEEKTLHNEINDLIKKEEMAKKAFNELERRLNAGEQNTKGEYVLNADVEKAKNEWKQQQMLLQEKKERVDKVNTLLSNVDDGKTASLDQQISGKKKDIKAIKTKAGEYAPLYQFEAIAADNRAVQEEMGKLKGIDDSDELVRILKDAIGRRDKTQIKAAMRKLSEDGNDNEAFEALVPREGSGYEGMQQLMRALSGQLNEKDLLYDKEYVDDLRKLNAGFNKDEAFTLGAQIAEMNKRTSHWEATAAYVMEGGKFREATEKEHTLIASAEFGKKSPQANMRDSNRLAYGKHTYDEQGNKHYEVTKIGQIMIQSYDVPRMIGRLPENMTESAAKFIQLAAERMAERGLLKNKDEKGVNSLAESIHEKANVAKGGEEGFNEQYNSLSSDVGRM